MMWLQATCVFIMCVANGAFGEEFWTLKNLGCWQDYGEKLVPGLEGSSPILDGYYKKRSGAVQKCAKAAMKRGFRVFVVQDGGWCGSSSSAVIYYKKIGKSHNCGIDGKGGYEANQVYEIVGDYAVEDEYHPEPEEELEARPKEFITHDLGCWSVPLTGFRSMEGLIQELDGHYHDREKALWKCAKGLAEIGFRIMAMYDGGKCLTVHNPGDFFVSSTPVKICGHSGKGSTHYLHLYRITPLASGSNALPKLFPSLATIFKYQTKTPPTETPEPKYFWQKLATKPMTHSQDPPSTGHSEEPNHPDMYRPEYPSHHYRSEHHSPAQQPESPPNAHHSEYMLHSNQSERPLRSYQPEYPASSEHGVHSIYPPVIPEHKIHQKEYIHLTNLGCWEYSWNNTIPTLEGISLFLKGHYSERKNAVEQCAKAAMSSGYEIIAIQDGGRCSSSNDARKRYPQIGRSYRCSEVGGSWVNQVYEVDLIWDVKVNGIGCFSSGLHNPIATLEGTSSVLNGNYQERKDAVRKCAELAARRGFKTFALHNGGECRGESYARYNLYGESNSCGKDGKGGPRANQVYEVLDGHKIKITSLGCWKDSDIHAVPGLEQTDGDLMDEYQSRENAIDKCARAAYRNGFLGFVLQDGGWCGGSLNVLENYSKYGVSNNCKWDGKGGMYANQVFKFIDH